MCIVDKEQLPKPFNEYWKMKKPLPTSHSTSTNHENLSKEWSDFLLAVKNHVEKDLQEE